MNITKKMKTIGISSLVAVTLMVSTSMVAFAASTASKAEPSTAVKPNQISISKSGTGINVETATVNLDNGKWNKTEPATTVTDKAK